jgi:hypothetical protein
MKKDFGLLAFVIPLAFACLREAPPAKVLVRRAGASAKAGILAFELLAFNSNILTLRLEDY